MCVCVCACKLGRGLVSVLHVAWYMCTNNANYGICTCAKYRSVDCSNNDKVQAMYSTCTLRIYTPHTHTHTHTHTYMYMYVCTSHPHTPSHRLTPPHPSSHRFTPPHPSQAHTSTSLTGSHPHIPHRLTPPHLPLHTHTPGFHAELFCWRGETIDHR